MRTVNRGGSGLHSLTSFIHSCSGSHTLHQAQGSMAPRVGELNVTYPHTLDRIAREGSGVKERGQETQRQRDRKNEQEAFSPLWRLGWGTCLINSGPSDLPGATKSTDP